MIATSKRVEVNTAPQINRCNAGQTQRNIAFFSEHPEQIGERLRELEAEWDIERVVEAQSSSLMLTGILLGVTVNRKFLIVPAMIAGFLLQHAIQGWCPPIPILRGLGVRTQSEIDAEFYALKEIQGRQERAGETRAASTREFANMI